MWRSLTITETDLIEPNCAEGRAGEQIAAIVPLKVA